MLPPLRVRMTPLLLPLFPSALILFFVDQCFDFPRAIHITTNCDVNH